MVMMEWCVTNVAYWHFNCAEVTQEILDEKWKNSEFLCVMHSRECAELLQDQSTKNVRTVSTLQG